MIKFARDKEAHIILEANKASAVGRLMLGQISNWDEFLECDKIDYLNLPRKQLKAGKNDINARLSAEIQAFCNNNFDGVKLETLIKLYDDIKYKYGLELPLPEFEKTYGKIKSNVIKGNPKHLTVCISLWGLQFKYPEEILSHDLIVCIQMLNSTSNELSKFNKSEHTHLVNNREIIRKHLRQKEFCIRAIMLTSFNILEAYLNGIAWDFYSHADITALSNTKIKTITDTSTVSIRDKLLKYPSIISGKEFIFDETIIDFLETLKPFRDSLVHASPFSAPEKFGGYDKLKKIYELNDIVGIFTIHNLMHIVKRIENHLGKSAALNWLLDLEETFNSTYEITIDKEGLQKN